MTMVVNPYRFASGDHFRLSMTSDAGVIELFEIEGYETWGGPNVFAGKPAISPTGSHGSHPPGDAVDGDATTTYWSTSGVTEPVGGAQWQVNAGEVSLVMIAIKPRVFSTTQTPNALLVESAPDAATWSTFMDFPDLENWNSAQERQFTPGGADASGWRYLWLKVTGNNFVGNSVSYAKEIRFVGANGENLALQNIAMIGNQSSANAAWFFGRTGGANGGAAFGLSVNDNVGVDLGRQRFAPVSVALDHANDATYCQHGIKQFEIYGSNTNNIGTATLLLTVNDVSGTPTSGETRTYAI